MSKKLKLSHLRAWDLFMVSHSETLRKIEKDLHGTLPFNWYEMLYLVNSQPGHRVKMTELARMLVLSKSALTRSVDSLEKVGFLKRTSCPSDGRVSYITVTAKGLQNLKSAWPVFRASMQKHFGDRLTIQEAKQLEQLLLKLIDVKDSGNSRLQKRLDKAKR